MRFVLVLSVFTLATAAAGAERLPSFPKGTEYGEARRGLLALGWEPVTMPDHDECRSGDTRCEGRPEMEGCSGVGMAACQFTWRRNGRLISVRTIGEDYGVVTGVRCRAGC